MENNKNSFDRKQYICDIKALTESILNGTANDDMLEKLKWKNINNYRIEYEDDNSASYMDFESDLFDNTKELIQPMKELLHVASEYCDIEVNMCIIKIISSYCENVYYQACCQKTYEENKAYIQSIESFSELINKLVHELQLKHQVKIARIQNK